METQLQLKGNRKRDWAGWTAQVFSFYSRVEAEGMVMMKKHGAKAEEVAQGKAMAEALMAIHQQKKSNAGDAQSATQKRDEALKALERWIADFKKVARVALQDDPQLLEALGIVVPSMR
jgi:transcriptional antiterminator